MRKALVLLCVAGVLALCAGPASAQTVFNGSLPWQIYLDASNTWVGTGTHIDWTIGQQVPGGKWTYTYTLTVANLPKIDHFILELSPGFSRSDFITVDWLEEDLAFGTWGPSADNPEFPAGASFYGVQFDNVGAKTKMIYFETNIGPTWGDFYAAGDSTRVFNTSITNADPTSPPSDTIAGGKLLRPDLTATVVPEPGSAVLTVIGLLPALRYRLRRR